jgi:hypothetical protein
LEHSISKGRRCAAIKAIAIDYGDASVPPFSGSSVNLARVFARIPLLQSCAVSRTVRLTVRNEFLGISVRWTLVHDVESTELKVKMFINYLDKLRKTSAAALWHHKEPNGGC